MKFVVESTVWDKPDRILKEYPALEHCGVYKSNIERPIHEWIKDENGKKVRQIVGYKPEEKLFVEISTIEELIVLKKVGGFEVVVGYYDALKLYYIEIYDGYRE